MVEKIAALSKLSLSVAEKEQAQKDMERMIAFVDKLKELDAETEISPSCLAPTENVFREDETLQETLDREDFVRNGLLKNAPSKQEGMFMVPKTVE
jgi:aspartyl-tRNA(Asn)/glutamyl-tRNA(Gln) amidotransferase subunit C